MKNSKLKTTIEPCLGIPVVFDETLEVVSDSRGLWRWKRIYVGPKLLGFPPREQQAILLHEAGHCKLRHLERRILAIFTSFFWPPRLLRICIAQEFQADRFAAGCGYGRDLANVFARFKGVKPGPLHPPLEERITRLLS